MAANPANPANPLVPEVDVSGHLSLIDKNKLTEQLRHSIIAKLTPEVKKDADGSTQEYRYAGDQTGFREWKKAVLTSCIMFGFERITEDVESIGCPATEDAWNEFYTPGDRRLLYEAISSTLTQGARTLSDEPNRNGIRLPGAPDGRPPPDNDVTSH